jgi:hypothetical protein
MSHHRQHPVDRLIATLEETASLMWQSYEAHMNLQLGTDEWFQKGIAIRLSCIACDERVERLKRIREGAPPTREDLQSATPGSARLGIGSPPAQLGLDSTTDSASSNAT